VIARMPSRSPQTRAVRIATTSWPWRPATVNAAIAAHVGLIELRQARPRVLSSYAAHGLQKRSLLGVQMGKHRIPMAAARGQLLLHLTAQFRMVEDHLYGGMHDHGVTQLTHS